jgi:uncharacterized membrane protein
MEQIRRAKSQFFVLACSLVGAGIAIYLTSVHYELAPLACSESGFVNCAHVLSSPYSVVPGTSIPISVPGLAWNLVMVALAIMGLRLQAGWLRPAQFAWSLAGMLTVLYLVYVEIVLLHTLCAWCTAMHVLILLMFLVTLARLAPSQPEVYATAPAEQEPAEAIRLSDRH